MKDVRCHLWNQGPGIARQRFPGRERKQGVRIRIAVIRLLFPPSLPRNARTLHETKVAERRQRMLQADPDIEGLHFLKVSDTTTSIEEICREYSADPNVVYAEPNYMVSIQATPNDPRFNELCGYSHNYI